MQTLSFPPCVTWLVRANIVGLALLGAACGDDNASNTFDSSSESSSSDSETTVDPSDTADTTMGETSMTAGESSSGPGEESSSGPGEESSSGPGEESSSSGGGEVCGDDVIEGAEECDGADLDGEDCISQDFDGGVLACGNDCSFDTSGCFNMACGNDMIEGKEVCDGNDLADATCESLGFVGGTLACADNCGDYDTSGCTTCGDDTVDPGETCDGLDLAGETCATQGFADGNLACAVDCGAFDTAGCSTTCAEEDIGGAVGPAVTSGNTAGEDNDLDGTCGAAGGPDRVISFTAPIDGIFVFDTFGSGYDTKLTLFADCDAFSEISCNDDFNGLQSLLSLDMSAGQTVLIVVDGFNGNVGNWVLNISSPVCGNDLVDLGESCDGADLVGLDCSAFGFDAGVLACQPDCLGFDSSGCASVCGNDIVGAGEACDGANLGGATCLSQGLGGGELTCAADCSLDTSGCGAPLNDCCFANGAPGCSDQACEDSICALDAFCCDNQWDGVCANAATGANGAGNACNVCADALCGNDLVGGAEVCDGTNVGGETCASQGLGDGLLVCGDDCSDYDTSDCLQVCGDEDIGEAVGAAVATGDTTGDDNDLNPSCGAGDANDHVMEFTAPWPGSYTIDTAGSNYDTVLALWSDCATEIACNNNVGGQTSSVTLDLADGQTILIHVDGQNGAVGAWTLNITAPPPPPFPNACEAGIDPGSGSAWVVCAADANTAWVSADSGGNYHPELICQSLGYTTVGEWGGTCGNVCGYCEGPTACDATGSPTFDLGPWNGVGNCGSDGLGEIICDTVQWTCI